MISDSPYDSGELVLTPGLGLAAGAAGGLAMLGFMYLLHLVFPASIVSLAGLLSQIGSLFASARAPETALIVVGGAIHLLVAGLLGLLYASSQRRIPVRGLLGVGVLFGFVTWVVSSVVVGWLGNQALSAVLRSWPWLLASLAYGTVVASFGVWRVTQRLPEPGLTVRQH